MIELKSGSTFSGRNVDCKRFSSPSLKYSSDSISVPISRLDFSVQIVLQLLTEFLSFESKTSCLKKLPKFSFLFETFKYEVVQGPFLRYLSSWMLSLSYYDQKSVQFQHNYQISLYRLSFMHIDRSLIMTIHKNTCRSKVHGLFDSLSPFCLLQFHFERITFLVLNVKVGKQKI